MCRECNKNFDSAESFQQHNNAKHKDKATEKKVKSSLKAGKKQVVLVISLVIVTAFSFLVYSSATGPAKYDAFAKCLTENDVKFYGAFWCPSCADQKAMFGKSAKYLNYIECSPPDRRGQTPACAEAGIESYPTCEFQNGERRTGVVPLEQLNLLSGCELA